VLHIAAVEADDLLRLLLLQWLEQERIQQAENRRDRANANREHQHRRQREARLLGEHAKAIPNVLQERHKKLQQRNCRCRLYELGGGFVSRKFG